MKSGQLAETNIFKSNSQLLHDIQPENIRPVSDRVLVRDIKDPDKIGSIWIPETAAERGLGKNGLLRMGEVVAIGPGDPYAKEWLERNNITGQHQVMRKALGVCPTCNGCGELVDVEVRFETRSVHETNQQKCPDCHGDGIRRWPMQCRVGDVVVYDRRKESEFYVNGERLLLIHEEQAILAILEGA